MSSLRNRRNWIMVKSFFKTAPKSSFWAPHLYTKNWVLSMIGLLKKPLSICQSGWKEIWNALESFGDPEQGTRRCFAEVNNRGQISSATHSRVCQVLTRRPRNWPFFFHFFFSVYLPWKRSSLSCLCSWSAASHFRRSKRKYLYPWVLEEIVPIRP